MAGVTGEKMQWQNVVRQYLLLDKIENRQDCSYSSGPHTSFSLAWRCDVGESGRVLEVLIHVKTVFPDIPSHWCVQRPTGLKRQIVDAGDSDLFSVPSYQAAFLQCPKGLLEGNCR